MLILTRKLGERIKIGEDIIITLISIKGGQVKLGIHAPKHIDIHREEIFERIREENLGASLVGDADLSEAADLIQKFKGKRDSS